MTSSTQPHMTQDSGASSSTIYRQESADYDRVITVPAQRAQSQMTSIRSGQRQPTEHPNDRPYSAEAGYSDGSSGIANAMANVALQPPTEHSENHPPYYNGGIPRAQDAMLANSRQRVLDWNDSISGEDESFVIEHDPDTFSSSMSLPNGDMDHRYHRSITDPGRSGFEHDSSDDDAGLQRSLVGIQGPPGMGGTTTCSRQSSSGSQSSLDSSLSFHTVYPSDAYSRRVQQPRQDDSNRAHLPQRPQMHGPTEHQQHSSSSRPQPSASTEPYFGRSQSHPDATRSSGQSGVRQINQNADQASREGHEQKSTSVFITYAEEQQNPTFKRLVLQLTRTLLSNGIQVRLDMLESTLMSMSVSSWLDDNIQKCDFVIVCVSPSYKSEVEQPVLPDTPDPHSLHTRYIYNRLLTEYIQNGSRNYRFIPVLLGGATRRHLPSLCLDTTVYEWPHQYEAIIYRLFKKEKYIQPRVGPPPRCTVETYGTHEAAAIGQ